MIDIKTDRNDTWTNLFRIHARSNRVIRHIMPSDNKPPPHVANLTYNQLATLDARMLQRIYSIIYVDFLNSIMELGSIDLASWTRLSGLFQDNQNACVVTIEHGFSGIRVENFPNVSTYFQCLKTLSDKLREIGALLNNHCLIFSSSSTLLMPIGVFPP